MKAKQPNCCLGGLALLALAAWLTQAAAPTHAAWVPEPLAQIPPGLVVPTAPSVLVLLDLSQDAGAELLTHPDESREALYGIAHDGDQAGAAGKYIYAGQARAQLVSPAAGQDYAPDEPTQPGKGLWRLRNRDFNRLYYDPSITYNPWPGLDAKGKPFANADPKAAPDDPFHAAKHRDLTANHSLTPGINYYWTWDESAGAYNDLPTRGAGRNYVDLDEQGKKIVIDATKDNGVLVEGSHYGPGFFPGGSGREDCSAHTAAPAVCTYKEELQNFANWYSYYRSRELAIKGALGTAFYQQQGLAVGFAELGSPKNALAVRPLDESLGQSASHKMALLNAFYAAGKGMAGTPQEPDAPTQTCQPQATLSLTTQQRSPALMPAPLASTASASNELGPASPAQLRDSLAEIFAQLLIKEASAALVFPGQQRLVGSTLYSASWNPINGTGQLIATEVSQQAGKRTLGDEIWRAAAALDALGADKRVLITWAPHGHEAVPFTYDQLSHRQAQALADQESCTSADGISTRACSAAFAAEVTSRINWVRGATTNEQPKGNLRARPDRQGRLGSLVNSAPVFYGPPARAGRMAAAFPQAAGETYADFAKAKANRPGMIYLAANDGMLHAFLASSGKEAFAFIPNAVITGAYNNRIKGLAAPSYRHRYTHDLTPAIEDAYLALSGAPYLDRAWATLLVGGLGAGGKGYYALNITHPTQLARATDIRKLALWEFTDEQDTYPSCQRPLADACKPGEALTNTAGKQLLDASISPARPYRDLGFSLSAPTIAMSNLRNGSLRQQSHEWVVMFGNGYNSTAGRAKLYILRIERGIDGDWCHPDQAFSGNQALGEAWHPRAPAKQCPGGADFVKIEAAGPVPEATLAPGSGGARLFANGLGSPRGIDLDGNGTMDYAYAGDRAGNLYRFDLRSSNPADWSAQAIFQARYMETDLDVNGDGDRMDSFPQPITTRPYVVRHPAAKTGADCDPKEGAVKACGGLIIIFATGSYLYEKDGAARSIQSIYGLWERFHQGAPVDRRRLVRQRLKFTDATEQQRTLTTNPVDYSLGKNGSSPHSGYYIDLDTRGYQDPTSIPLAGERLVGELQYAAGLLVGKTVIPSAKAGCRDGLARAQIAFCPLDGSTACAGGQPIFDSNRNGKLDPHDLAGDQPPASLIQDASQAAPSPSAPASPLPAAELLPSPSPSTRAAQGNTGRLSWRRLEAGN